MARAGGMERSERLTRLLEHQELLARVARDLGPATELEPVLHVVLDGMRSVLDFRGGSICLVDDAGVYVAASDPHVADEVAALRLPVGTGLAGRAIAAKEPVYSPDITADDRVDSAVAATGSNRGMRSYLVVPLVCLGEVIGLLQVDSIEPDAFDADDIRLLEGLATQVAGAIEGARRFEAVKRLEDARAMFIARVGHELRTPVTILRGLTSTMLNHPTLLDDRDATAELLARVDAAGGRLQALTEELLTVATLETGLLVGDDPVPTGLHALLEQVRDDSVDPDRVVLADGPDPEVLVDRTVLRQILGLLVQNALAYAGGAELVAADDDGGRPCVAVVDHGPGIPDERKAVVFERFARGSHTGPGWGLGLSVAQRLASAIGAEVRLSDTPGGGATFTVALRGR